MRPFLSIHCLVIASLLGPTDAKSQQKSQFVSIFDGKSLQGWKTRPTQAKCWEIVDGKIVGSSAKTRSYLEYKQNDLSNFEFKFEYRFSGKGNSGVNVRAVPDPTGKRDFQAYHADLGHVGIGGHILGAWDFHTPNRIEHGCRRGERLEIDGNDRPKITKIEKAIQVDQIKTKDWNRVHLIVKDNRFQFFINDRLSSEFVEHLPLNRRLLKGALQLQLHDPETRIEFRALKLKIVGESSAKMP